MRPDYPTIVYSKILKELLPDVPLVAGWNRSVVAPLSHYDYTQDRLRPSIIADAPVDYDLSMAWVKKAIGRNRSAPS